MFMMSQVSWFNHRFECHLHPHRRYFSLFCGDHNAVCCCQCRMVHGGGENLRQSDQFKGQNQDKKLRPITTLYCVSMCYWCQQGAKKLVPDLVTTMLFNVSTSKMLKTNFLLLFLRFFQSYKV